MSCWACKHISWPESIARPLKIFCKWQSDWSFFPLSKNLKIQILGFVISPPPPPSCSKAARNDDEDERENINTSFIVARSFVICESRKRKKNGMEKWLWGSYSIEASVPHDLHCRHHWHRRFIFLRFLCYLFQ